MDVQRQVKSLLTVRSPSENLVKQATSLSVSNVSLTRAYEIATFTSDPKECIKIFNYIFKRLNDDEKYIQHISNALQLTKYLLVFGSKNFFDMMLSRRNTIESLKKYHTINSEHGWMATKIKELANVVCNMLENSEYRKKIQKELKSEYNHDTHLSAFPSNDDQNISDLKAGIYPKSREEEEDQLRLALELSSREAQRLSNPAEVSSRYSYSGESPDYMGCNDPFQVPRGGNDGYTDSRMDNHYPVDAGDIGFQTSHLQQRSNFPNAYIESNPFTASNPQSQFPMETQGYGASNFADPTNNFNSQSGGYPSSQAVQMFNSSNSVPAMTSSNDRINSRFGSSQPSFGAVGQSQNHFSPSGSSAFFDQTAPPMNSDINAFSRNQNPFATSNQNSQFGQSSAMSSNSSAAFNDPFGSSINPFGAADTGIPGGFPQNTGGGFVGGGITQTQGNRFAAPTDPFGAPMRPPGNQSSNNFDQSKPFGTQQSHNNFW